MPGPLQDVQSGQPLRIPAARHNAWNAAARGVEAVQQSGGGAPLSGIGDTTTVILVQNKTDDDIDRFGVLGLDVPVFGADTDEFKNRVVMKGVTPVIATHTGKFVVAMEPIKKDGIGRAAIQGVFPCLLNVTSGSDTFADVQESSLELKTGASGAARIIYKQSGTGTGKFAYVQVGGGSSGSSGQWFKIKTDASSGIAVCNTWNGTTTGSEDVNVKIVTKLKAGETLFAHEYAGYATAAWREAAPDGCQFPVKLTQTGGSAGSKTTKCSFAYTVKDPSNVYTYATGVTPEGQADYNNRKRKAATFGWAYLDSGGTLKLLCNEEHGSGAC